MMWSPPPAPMGFHTRQKCGKRPWTLLGPDGAQEEPPHSAQKPTNVQDPVPRPAPPPALQLLVLRVLQTPVMKYHADDALGAGARVGGVAGGRTAECRAQRDPQGTHPDLPPIRQTSLPPRSSAWGLSP